GGFIRPQWVRADVAAARVGDDRVRALGDALPKALGFDGCEPEVTGGGQKLHRPEPHWDRGFALPEPRHAETVGIEFVAAARHRRERLLGPKQKASGAAAQSGLPHAFSTLTRLASGFGPKK